MRWFPRPTSPKLRSGEKALVTLDTFGSGVSFDAVVAAVDPAETVAGDVGAYGVKLQFVKDDARVKSGMTANISIATGDAKA